MKKITVIRNTPMGDAIKKFRDSGDTIRVNILSHLDDYFDNPTNELNDVVIKYISKGVPESSIYMYLTDNVEHWITMGNHPFGKTCTSFSISKFQFTNASSYSNIIPYYINEPNTNLLLMYSEDVSGMTIEESLSKLVARVIVTKVGDSYIIHRLYSHSAYNRDSLINSVSKYLNTNITIPFNRLKSSGLRYRGYADIFDFDGVKYHILSNDEKCDTSLLIQEFIAQISPYFKEVHDKYSQLEGKYDNSTYTMRVINEMQHKSYFGYLPMNFYENKIEITKNNNFLKEN